MLDYKKLSELEIASSALSKTKNRNKDRADNEAFESLIRHNAASFYKFRSAMSTIDTTNYREVISDLMGDEYLTLKFGEKAEITEEEFISLKGVLERDYVENYLHKSDNMSRIYPTEFKEILSLISKDMDDKGAYLKFLKNMPLLRLGSYIPYDADKKHAYWLDEVDDLALDTIGRIVASSRRTSFPIKFSGSDSASDLVYLFPGFYTIAGEGNSGKSTLCQYLKERLNASYIKLREPEGNSFINIRKFLDDLNVYIYNLDDLFIANNGRDKIRDVLIIDSFKHFSYNVSSNSPSIGAGILADVFEDINILSQICSKFGLVMFGVFNFYSMSDKNAQLIWNALISNSTGVFSCQKMEESIGITYLARNDLNKRSPSTFRVEFSDVYSHINGAKGKERNREKLIKTTTKPIMDKTTEGSVSSLNRIFDRLSETRGIVDVIDEIDGEDI